MPFMPPQRGFAPQMQPQQPQMARPRPMDVAGPMINPGVGQGPVNNVPGMNMYGQQAPQPANAYFASNPDVAAAYQQNSYGMTPDRFALQHFQQYGQNEGRQWSGPSAPQSPNILQSSLAQRGAAPTGLLSPFMNQLGAAQANQAQMMLGNNAGSMYPQGASVGPAQSQFSPVGGGMYAQGGAPGVAQPGMPQQQAQMPGNNWVSRGFNAMQSIVNSPAYRQQATQPQALGQSANYSPANRPVSPWFGYSGVNY